MNARPIEQLIAVTRDLTPLLEQLRDVAVDVDAAGLDGLIGASTAQLLYLVRRVDEANLQAARARHSRRITS